MKCGLNHEQEAKLRQVLKELASTAMGMVAAFAFSQALQTTFRKHGPGAEASFAFFVSYISILSLGIMKLQIAPSFPEVDHLWKLTKVILCLLSAKAWHAVAEIEGSTTLLFIFAFCLTLGTVIFLIYTYKAYMRWTSKWQSQCRPCPACFVHHHAVGCVIWVPITTGFFVAAIWNSFCVRFIKEKMADGDADRILFLFLYAIITIPVALSISLYSLRVAKKGWGCFCCQCAGSLGEPCCGLEAKIADPITSMFKDLFAAALMAFAWNDAFSSPWEDAGVSANWEGHPPPLYYVVAYVICAACFGAIAIYCVETCVEVENPAAVVKNASDKTIASANKSIASVRSLCCQCFKRRNAQKVTPQFDSIGAPRLPSSQIKPRDRCDSPSSRPTRRSFSFAWSREVRDTIHSLISYTCSVILALAINVLCLVARWHILGDSADDMLLSLWVYALIMLVIAFCLCWGLGEALEFAEDIC